MRKKIIALVCLLAAACLVLSGCKMVSNYALKVNDTYYTVNEVADEVREHLAEEQDAETDSVKQHVADEMIRSAVIRQKISEYRIALTDDELAAARTASEQEREEAIWNNTWNTYFYYMQLPEEQGGGSVSYDAVEARVMDIFDNTVGLRLTDFQASAVDSALEKKLLEAAVPTATFNEADLQAEYAEHTSDDALADVKAYYDGDFGACAEAIQNGQTVFYRPTDYRLVKQILIQYDQHFRDEISALEDELKDLNDQIAAMEAAASVEAAAEAVPASVEAPAEAVPASVEAPAEAVPASVEAPAETVPSSVEAAAETISGSVEAPAASVEAAAPTLAELKQKQAEKQAELDAKREEAYGSIQEEADAVVAAARAGEDWSALVAEHNDNPGMNSGVTAEMGYVIYAAKTDFDKSFMDAAMALENVGDITEPTRGASDGLYIIRLEKVLPAGVAGLEDVRFTLESELLVRQWISDADVEMDLNRVKVD